MLIIVRESFPSRLFLTGNRFVDLWAASAQPV